MTKSGKHCGKWGNCSFWAISSFVTMFSKSCLLQRREKASIWGKGLSRRRKETLIVLSAWHIYSQTKPVGAVAQCPLIDMSLWNMFMLVSSASDVIKHVVQGKRFRPESKIIHLNFVLMWVKRLIVGLDTDVLNTAWKQLIPFRTCGRIWTQLKFIKKHYAKRDFAQNEQYLLSPQFFQYIG